MEEITLQEHLRPWKTLESNKRIVISYWRAAS
jgi:hypothetical protein